MKKFAWNVVAGLTNEADNLARVDSSHRHVCRGVFNLPDDVCHTQSAKHNDCSRAGLPRRSLGCWIPGRNFLTREQQSTPWPRLKPLFTWANSFSSRH